MKIQDAGTVVEKHELWSLAGLGLNLGPDFTSYLILRLSELNGNCNTYPTWQMRESIRLLQPEIGEVS